MWGLDLLASASMGCLTQGHLCKQPLSPAGHSLGGALSILAAYDIQTEFAFPLRQVQGSSKWLFGLPEECNKHSRIWLLACCWSYSANDACSSLFEQMEVYTFGCPRVGNASFSAAYDKLVPETWHVINDRDTVSWSP